ncbi:MAG TPA: sensor histidine kinase [Micromonosporaceae bacterium]
MTATHVAAPTRGAQPQHFDHLGMFYHDAGQYVAGVTAFVRSAVVAGQPVLVVVPGRNLELLRRSIGADADRVQFADMAVVGRNPGRIIPSLLSAFATTHRGRRPAIVGEPIWPERTAMEYPACVAHEALINAVFADHDGAILCPYDAARLNATALADAARTHPVLSDGERTWRSDWYGEPVTTAAVANVPLPAPPGDAAVLTFRDRHDLTAVRRFLAEQATAAGLPEEQLGDLVVAVNELAANTVEHAAGAGRLAVWQEDGVLVCQVDDSGQLTDPLAGYVLPPADAHRGRGLVLVNQLCDLTRRHTRPDGTSIRVQMRRPADRPVSSADYRS